ncbi:hypothetical protein KAR91_70625 [Candidatus Pacearchaeota archaeon]|nr:hypothetical protein [Candidatus Pacearchaeota archaeon]
MAKDPAFLFYPGDWIGGTMGMTFEEKGAYMEILMMQFNRGHMTSHMIGLVIGQLWDNIKDKFEVDEKGLYYNARLDLEKENRKKFTASRRNNLSGKNQYSKPIEKSGHMTSHMEDVNKDEDKDKKEDETKIEIWPTFEDFWTAYNKKVGSKEKCKKKFNKLSQDIKEQIMSHIFEYVKATPDKQFRKHPESYLNGKAWNDEIINTNGKGQNTITENLRNQRDELFAEINRERNQQ